MTYSSQIPELCFDRDALIAEVEAASGRRVGRNLMCFCPIHANKNTEAAHILQADNGVWRMKCFVCHPNGQADDIFGLRARLRGRERSEMIREWADKVKPSPLPADRARPAPPPREPEKPPRTAANAKEIKALYEDRFEDWYGYGEDGKGFRWIVVRHRTARGKSMGQWTRLEDGSYVERGPGHENPRPLWRLSKLASSDVVVWVEGEKCVKALEKYGFTATTSMGGCNAVQLTDYSPLKGKTVYVWPDKDGERQKFKGQEAGAYVAKEAQRQGATTVYVVDIDALTELPECGDVADFIEQMEKEEIPEDVIRGALWDVLRMGKKEGASAGVFELMRKQARREIVTLKMAHECIHQTRALKPGSIMMVNGKPGSAKSFYVLFENMKHHDAGEKVAMLMLEGDREGHCQRALAHKEQDGRICDPDYLEGKEELVEQARGRWEAWMDGFAPRIWDKHDFPDDTATIPQVLQWVEDRLKEGCRLLTIDPITIVMPTEKMRFNEDKKFTAKVGSLLKKYKASLIMVTHPKPGNKLIDLDNMQLGFAYQGFTMTVIFIEQVDPEKKRWVRNRGCSGMKQLNFNRIFHLQKTRDGNPEGRQVGMHFDGKTLQFVEQGFLQNIAGADDKPKKADAGF